MTPASARRRTAPASMWVWSDGDPADLVSSPPSRRRPPVRVRLPFPRRRARPGAAPRRPRRGRRHRVVGDVRRPRWGSTTATSCRGTHGARDRAVRRRAPRRRAVLAPGRGTQPTHSDQRFLVMLGKVQRADARPMQVDVPFWYGDCGPTWYRESLADAVLDVADGVTVMSYRDTATGPNSLLAVAEDMLARAEAPACRSSSRSRRTPSAASTARSSRKCGRMRDVIADVTEHLSTIQRSPALPSRLRRLRRARVIAEWRRPVAPGLPPRGLFRPLGVRSRAQPCGVRRGVDVDRRAPGAGRPRPSRASALRLGYGPVEGSPELRAAIAARTTSVEPEDVLCFAGAEEAIFWAMQLLVGPGSTRSSLCRTTSRWSPCGRHRRRDHRAPALDGVRDRCAGRSTSTGSRRRSVRRPGW